VGKRLNTKELFEVSTTQQNQQLTGYMDVNGLMSLLPGIDNPMNFTSAMGKLRLGQEGSLTSFEKFQLANAWTAFVGLPPQQKSIVSDKLMDIMDAPKPQQQQGPAQAQNQGQQQQQAAPATVATTTSYT
jgi:predicted lipid-binding transport protein (Tim44 family)